MNPERKPCPECNSTELYSGAVGVQSPDINLLPGLGSLGATVQAVVCCDCGSMRYFVPQIQAGRIKKSSHWQKLDVQPAD